MGQASCLSENLLYVLSSNTASAITIKLMAPTQDHDIAEDKPASVVAGIADARFMHPVSSCSAAAGSQDPGTSAQSSVTCLAGGAAAGWLSSPKC